MVDLPRKNGGFSIVFGQLTRGYGGLFGDNGVHPGNLRYSEIVL